MNINHFELKLRSIESELNCFYEGEPGCITSIIMRHPVISKSLESEGCISPEIEEKALLALYDLSLDLKRGQTQRYLQYKSIDLIGNSYQIGDQHNIIAALQSVIDGISGKIADHELLSLEKSLHDAARPPTGIAEEESIELLMKLLSLSETIKQHLVGLSPKKGIEAMRLIELLQISMSYEIVKYNKEKLHLQMVKKLTSLVKPGNNIRTSVSVNIGAGAFSVTNVMAELRFTADIQVNESHAIQEKIKGELCLEGMVGNDAAASATCRVGVGHSYQRQFIDLENWLHYHEDDLMPQMFAFMVKSLKGFTLYQDAKTFNELEGLIIRGREELQTLLIKRGVMRNGDQLIPVINQKAGFIRIHETEISAEVSTNMGIVPVNLNIGASASVSRWVKTWDKRFPMLNVIRQEPSILDFQSEYMREFGRLLHFPEGYPRKKLKEIFRTWSLPRTPLALLVALGNSIYIADPNASDQKLKLLQIRDFLMCRLEDLWEESVSYQLIVNEYDARKQQKKELNCNLSDPQLDHKKKKLRHQSLTGKKGSPPFKLKTTSSSNLLKRRSDFAELAAKKHEMEKAKKVQGRGEFLQSVTLTYAKLREQLDLIQEKLGVENGAVALKMADYDEKFTTPLCRISRSGKEHLEIPKKYTGAGQTKSLSFTFQGKTIGMTISENFADLNPDSEGVNVNFSFPLSLGPEISSILLRQETEISRNLKEKAGGTSVPLKFSNAFKSALHSGILDFIGIMKHVHTDWHSKKELDCCFYYQPNTKKWVLQYVRLLSKNGVSAYVKGVNINSAATCGGGISISGTQNEMQIIGIDTLSYLQLKYNAFRSQNSTILDSKTWSRFVEDYASSFQELFSRMADPSKNVRQEAEAIFTALIGEHEEAIQIHEDRMIANFHEGKDPTPEELEVIKLEKAKILVIEDCRQRFTDAIKICNDNPSEEALVRCHHILEELLELNYLRFYLPAKESKLQARRKSSSPELAALLQENKSEGPIGELAKEVGSRIKGKSSRKSRRVSK